MDIKAFIRDSTSRNIIQGSVLLDNENKENYTKLLLGIYTTKNIHEQYKRVKARPVNSKTKLSGTIYRVLSDCYTKDNA